MPAEYVFIVGMPRTGTTLTRRILNRSGEISLGGESHYFGESVRLRFWIKRDFRRTIAGLGGLTTEAGVDRVLDHIYAIRSRSFWGWIAGHVDRDAFRRAVLASDRSDRAFLDIALGFHAQGRHIRGEKTPANVYALPILLDWFPGARIVHTFRDPRAIFVSIRRKRQNLGRWWRASRLPGLSIVIDLYSSLRLILSWRRIVQLHRRYERQYAGQYLMVRYEDLVTEPRSEIQRLCAFLGVDFSEEMLDQSSVNSSFRRRHEIRGFDPGAVDRWKRDLPPLVQRWFRLWCGRALRDLGYDH